MTPGERKRVLAGMKRLDDFEGRLEEIEKIVGNFKDVRAARVEAEAHIKRLAEKEEARVREEDRKAKETVARQAAADAEAAVKRARELLESLQPAGSKEKPRR